MIAAVYHILFEKKNYYYFNEKEELQVARLNLIQSIFRRYCCCFYADTKKLKLNDLQIKIFQNLAEKHNVTNLHLEAAHYFHAKKPDSIFKEFFENPPQHQISLKNEQKPFPLSQKSISSEPTNPISDEDLLFQGNQIIARVFKNDDSLSSITLYTTIIEKPEIFCQFLKKSLERTDEKKLFISSFEGPSTIAIEKLIPIETLLHFGIEPVENSTEIALSNKRFIDFFTLQQEPGIVREEKKKAVSIQELIRSFHRFLLEENKEA